MINEDHISLMASTAYSIPSLIDIESLPIIDKDHVIKMINMFMDEAILYINKLGIRPLPIEYVKEDAYILCNNALDYLGEFRGGAIPQHTILKYISNCSKIAMLHSHPIPMPMPTLEDIIASYQIGYNIECVISRVSNYLATMMCVEPRKKWRDVIEYSYNAVEYFLKTSKYIVVGDSSYIEFLPFPDTAEQDKMVKTFIDMFIDYVKMFYVKINLIHKVYDVEMFV